MPAPALAPVPARVIRLADGLAATLYQTWELPPALVSAWELLAAAYGDAGVFLRQGWFEEWWAAFAGQSPPQILVIERSGETLGIFPLCRDSGDGGVSCLRSMTSEVYYDFLVAPSERPGTITAFLEAVRAFGLHVPAIVLAHIAHDSPNLPVLEAALGRGRVPYGHFQRPYAPYLDLRSTGWEQYTAALDSKLRNNLRRGQKRAAQAGVLSFAVTRAGDGLDAVIDEAFDVEFQSWKGTSGAAIRSDHRKMSFYRGMAKWAADSGCLYLFTLRLDGRMIAFDLCIAGGRTIFMIKTGYDAVTAGRLSPGNLMRYQVLEYLFRTGGFDRYDFFGACESWKLEWTSRTNTVVSLDIFPATISGWCAYARKYAWKKPLKRVVSWAAHVRRGSGT